MFRTMEVGQRHWRIFHQITHFEVHGVWVTFSTQGKTRFQPQINPNGGDWRYFTNVTTDYLDSVQTLAQMLAILSEL